MSSARRPAVEEAVLAAAEREPAAPRSGGRSGRRGTRSLEKRDRARGVRRAARAPRACPRPRPRGAATFPPRRARAGRAGGLAGPEQRPVRVEAEERDAPPERATGPAERSTRPGNSSVNDVRRSERDAGSTLHGTSPSRAPISGSRSRDAVHRRSSRPSADRTACRAIQYRSASPYHFEPHRRRSSSRDSSTTMGSAGRRRAPARARREGRVLRRATPRRSIARRARGAARRRAAPRRRPRRARARELRDESEQILHHEAVTLVEARDGLAEADRVRDVRGAPSPRRSFATWWWRTSARGTRRCEPGASLSTRNPQSLSS